MLFRTWHTIFTRAFLFGGVLLACLFAGWCTNIHAQTTFNTRSDLGLVNSILTTVIETDTGYITTGLTIDTGNNYYSSLLLQYYNLNGLPTTQVLLRDSGNILCWHDATMITNDGYIATVGRATYPYNDFRENIIFLKFDGQGNTVFKQVYSHADTTLTNINRPFKLLQLQDSTYMILAQYTFNGKSQICLLKTDKNGNELWREVYPNTSSVLPHSIVPTSDKGFIIGAWRTNVFYESEDFESQSYLLKVDSAANIEWEYLTPITELHGPVHEMVVKSEDTIIFAGGIGEEYVTGTLFNQLLFEPEALGVEGHTNAFWSHSSLSDIPHYHTFYTNVVELNDGSFILLGNEFYMDTSGSSNAYARLTKVSADYTVEWFRDFTHYELPNNAYNIRVNDLKSTSDGGFIFCGEAVSGLTADTIPQRSWLVKVDEYGCLVPGCQLVGMDAFLPEQPFAFKAGPNPASTSLNVYLTATTIGEHYSIQLLDLNGRVVRSETFLLRDHNLSFTLSVEGITAGTYLLMVEDYEGHQQTERILVE